MSKKGEIKRCPDCNKPLRILGWRNVFDKEGKVEKVCMDCYYHRKFDGKLNKPPATRKDPIKLAQKYIPYVLIIGMCVCGLWFGVIDFVLIGVHNWNYYLGSGSFVLLIISEVFLFVAYGLATNKYKFEPPKTSEKKKTKWEFRPPQMGNVNSPFKKGPPTTLNTGVCQLCNKEKSIGELQRYGNMIACDDCIKKRNY